jgi:hypothetical protein
LEISKEWILSEILNGRWIAHRLAPHYQKSLVKALTSISHLKASLNYFTLLYYGRISSPSKLDGLELEKFFNPVTSSQDLIDVFSRIAVEIFGEGCGIKAFSECEIERLDAAMARAKEIWADDSDVFTLSTLFVRVNQAGLGASFPQSFGTIYYGNRLTDIASESLAISLGHELAHHELFLINLYDRLVVPEFDKSLRFAPLQKKVRPPIGRLHSLYALFRMIQTKRRTGSEFANDLSMFRATEDTFGKDELSPFAREMVAAMGKAIS